jgi:Anti-sigma-K factor rskA
MTGEHPVDELPALLAGELDLPTLRSITRHLRVCASCQAELVEVAASAGALRYAATATPEALAEPPSLPPLAPPGRTPTSPAARSHRRRGRKAAMATVAAAAVAVIVSLAVLLPGGRSPGLSATLMSLGPPGATGTVHMSAAGAQRTMTVTTTLPAPPPASFYQVWLLQTADNKMVPVGLLSSGRGRYVLPATIVARYDAVDISLQADNGNPAHSADSVLRARYQAS